MSPARGGWHSLLQTIREPFAGAWQRNIDLSPQNVASHPVVYACVTRIASDIGKLSLDLVEEAEDGIWEKTDSPAFSPVLRRPNHFQSRQEFVKQWIFSKLFHGNTYVWKERDERRVVVALYILDPCTTRVLVAPDSSIYYEVRADNLSGLTENAVIPASEIIHDRNAIHHALCGISPITACALSAAHGLNIMNNAASFFANGANPGGILTAPAHIPQEVADRIKDTWETKFTGNNSGRIAVLGDGLEYKQMTVNAVDAQLIEQLKLTAEMICTAFHVPAYKVGVGQMPAYNNIGALNTQYFAEALEDLIKAMQTGLADGLAIPDKYRIRFNLDDLILMDLAARMQIAKDGVNAAIFKPDEARKRFNLGSVEGGDTPYLQQQMFSLAALAERDANKPFSKPEAPASGAPATPALPQPDPQEGDDQAKAIRDAGMIFRGLMFAPENRVAA